MLKIRVNGSTRFQLEKQIGKDKDNKYGIWEYHVAANSDMFPGHRTGRYAAILPPEPKEGQEVEAFALLTPSSPREEWKPCDKGVAKYE